MTDGKGPLNGVRVIDLGRHQAGPRCAQVLARLGAEVIKIERLGGEETRYHAPWVRKQSAYWVQYNSGKKSVSMDLRKEDAKAALRKLIKISDVVVQNFRPGTIDEMGFGYDVLKQLNPRPAACIPARMAGCSSRPETSTTGLGCAARSGNRSGRRTPDSPLAASAASMPRRSTKRCGN